MARILHPLVVVACESYVLLWSDSARLFSSLSMSWVRFWSFWFQKEKNECDETKRVFSYLKFLQIGFNLCKGDYGISKQHIFGVNCAPLNPFAYKCSFIYSQHFCGHQSFVTCENQDWIILSPKLSSKKTPIKIMYYIFCVLSSFVLDTFAMKWR